MPQYPRLAEWVRYSYQRRTTTGKRGNKKPGLNGTVKKPRLRAACITCEGRSDRMAFFNMFQMEIFLLPEKPLQRKTKIKFQGLLF